MLAATIHRIPLIGLAGALALPASACDLCAVYSAQQAKGEVGRGAFLGAAEQFTHYGTVQDTGHEVANPGEQFLDSSISQVLVGYNFSERVGVQFSLPVIYRSFRRAEGFGTQNGTESGIGDAALIGHWLAINRESKRSTIRATVLGGVKFPTGSSDRLSEELAETESPPGAPPSVVHGHELTLGSGSWDGVVGGSFYARYHRLFFTAAVQYAIRSEGDFGYQFANDVIWSGGPGVLLAMTETCTVSLQLAVTGEDKGEDTLNDVSAHDTAVTSVFLGPQFSVTLKEQLSFEAGVDFPVLRDNSGVQIAPDWRVRAAVVWRF